MHEAFWTAWLIGPFSIWIVIAASWIVRAIDPELASQLYGDHSGFTCFVSALVVLGHLLSLLVGGAVLMTNHRVRTSSEGILFFCYWCGITAAIASGLMPMGIASAGLTVAAILLSLSIGLAMPAMPLTRYCVRRWHALRMSQHAD